MFAPPIVRADCQKKLVGKFRKIESSNSVNVMVVLSVVGSETTCLSHRMRPKFVILAETPYKKKNFITDAWRQEKTKMMLVIRQSRVTQRTI